MSGAIWDRLGASSRRKLVPSHKTTESARACSLSCLQGRGRRGLLRTNEEIKLDNPNIATLQSLLSARRMVSPDVSVRSYHIEWL